ncbi:MAG: hypothetical protein ACKV0T_02560 [Planctomycetales bacterium]
MSNDDHTAWYYLASPFNSFWEWRDEGQVVCWQDGGTIAFAPEVTAVVRRLADQGLPPFDAIVMFLAACRGNWQGATQEFRRPSLQPLRLHERDGDLWNQGFRELLDSIAALPVDLRDSPERKASLAAIVFELAVPARTADVSLEILRELERWSTRLRMMIANRQVPRDDLRRGLMPFWGLPPVITAEHVRLRQATGLDQLPQAAPDQPPPAESLRQLLNQLAEDEELGGLVRLTRNLMAALSIPRSVSEPQELPLGGVSDISNRGSFDRLLVSELAQDDLTFTVRVALNEALYLRREAPPQLPPQHRLVLLDSGVRMWGVPRVYGTAAALALAAGRDPRTTTQVYRARGPHLDLVEVNTRAGLQAHLSVLQPEGPPALALPLLERLATGDDRPGEAVLVTSEDSLNEPAFQQALAQVKLPALYLVSVTREGRLRLTRRTPLGSKLLTEIHCPLGEILAPQPRTPELIDPRSGSGLPAILGVRPFPLRLPASVDPASLWGGPTSGPLSITSDGRLLHWDHTGWGPRQLSDTIPPGRLHWHDGANASKLMTAVVGRLSQGGLRLLFIDRDSGVCITVPLRLHSEFPRGVAAHAGVLFVICREHVELFSLDGGAFINTAPLPNGMIWLRDRFFAVQSQWYALSYDGSTARFELVCEPASLGAGELLTIADLRGIDGPAVVTRQGEVIRLDRRDSQGKLAEASVVLRLPPGASRGSRAGVWLAAVSPAGDRLVLQPDDASDHRRFLLDLEACTSAETRGDPRAALVAHLLAQIRNRTLRNRFHAIGTDGGRLVLIASRQGEPYRIESDCDRRQLVLQQCPRGTGTNMRQFTNVDGPAGTHYTLREATWSDGSAVFLDSRGLLHLKSSDPTIPELTLVLTDGALAGWCADGSLFGPPYFTEVATGRDPMHIEQNVLRRFVSVLQ